MNNLKKGSGGRRSRSKKNLFVTKSGATIKIHRSLGDRIRSQRDSRARRKAERLIGLPKSRIKRFFYRLHPKRVYRYWFSREGAVMALKITGIGLIGGFLLMVGVFAYFRKDLPNLRDISGNNIGGSVLYYDSTNTVLLWEDVDGVKRIPVKDENISQYIKDATIAIEDKDFFRHGGFDVRGIARAGWNNAFGDGGKQGGSTITQQLVRLTQTGVGKEQTYQRKIKELILSIELERSYTKQEILTGYLNAAPYGGIEYGVEAAAQNYFEKSAKDLNLEESTLLAVIPKSPYYYSKYSGGFDKEDTIGRQHYILDLMVEQGKITREQADNAKKVDILATIKDRKPRYNGIKAPFFVLAAKEQLEQQRGEQTVKLGGLRVTTTLDMHMQNIAEEQVSKGLGIIRRNGFDSAAFVAEDVRTGHVVALVGGADFNAKNDYNEINFARTKLPPGSSFKPYDYLALIEHSNNFGAGSVLYDTKGPLEGYPCDRPGIPPPRGNGNCLHDFDLRFPGPLTLRYALGGSRNVPAVKAMLITGVDKTIETAMKLGLSEYKCYHPDTVDINRATKSDEIACGASSALGDGAYLKLDEHVSAYSTISRNGRKIPQVYIKEIKDSQGKPLYQWKPTEGEQVVRPESAYIVADMMADPNASYFPNKPHRYKGHQFSLKTGTTNNSRDGWLMGFSNQYSAGVWVGHHTRRVETRAFMESMTLPIWQGWMNKVHDGVQPEERAKPAGLQTLPAFVVRTHVGLGSVEPSPANDLYPGWYQPPKKATGTKRTIDIVSNKLATDCTPGRAKKDVTYTAADAFSGDRFVNNGQNGTADAKDDIHSCDDAKPGIAFAGPPGSCVVGTACIFSINVSPGTHPLSSAQFSGVVNLKVDGQVVQSTNVAGPGTVSLSYTASEPGTKDIIAEVIDSVLYEASTGTSVTFTGSSGGGTGDPLLSPAGGSGNSASFSWSGGTAPYVVVVTKTAPPPGGTAACNSPSGTSCTVAPLPPPHIGSTYQAYVRDGAGKQSNTVTFSR